MERTLYTKFEPLTNFYSKLTVNETQRFRVHFFDSKLVVVANLLRYRTKLQTLHCSFKEDRSRPLSLNPTT